MLMWQNQSECWASTFMQGFCLGFVLGVWCWTKEHAAKSLFIRWVYCIWQEPTASWGSRQGVGQVERRIVSCLLLISTTQLCVWGANGDWAAKAALDVKMLESWQTPLRDGLPQCSDGNGELQKMVPSATGVTSLYTLYLLLREGRTTRSACWWRMRERLRYSSSFLVQSALCKCLKAAEEPNFSTQVQNTFFGVVGDAFSSSSSLNECTIHQIFYMLCKNTSFNTGLCIFTPHTILPCKIFSLLNLKALF